MVVTTAGEIREAVAHIRDFAGEPPIGQAGFLTTHLVEGTLRVGYGILTRGLGQGEPLEGFQRARLCRALAMLEDGLKPINLRGSALDLAGAGR